MNQTSSEVVRSVPEIISFLERKIQDQKKTNKRRGVSSIDILRFCGATSYLMCSGSRKTKMIQELFAEHDINWECRPGSGWFPRYEITENETLKHAPENLRPNEFQSLLQDLENQTKNLVPGDPGDPRIEAIKNLALQGAEVAQQGLNIIKMAIVSIAEINKRS